MIELRPNKGNKPFKGKYSTDIAGVPYIVEFERLGSKIQWLVLDSTGKALSNLLDNKQAAIGFLEALESPSVKITDVVYEWVATAPMGNKVNIRVQIETLGSGTLAMIYTSAQNPENSQLAENWLLQEVKSFFTDVPEFNPSKLAIRWGKY